MSLERIIYYIKNDPELQDLPPRVWENEVKGIIKSNHILVKQNGMNYHLYIKDGSSVIAPSKPFDVTYPNRSVAIDASQKLADYLFKKVKEALKK